MITTKPIIAELLYMCGCGHETSAIAIEHKCPRKEAVFIELANGAWVSFTCEKCSHTVTIKAKITPLN